MSKYVLGTGAGELQRLIGQADLLRAGSAQMLDNVGIRPGDQAIDVGCGPIGVLDILSEGVGPTGIVIGLERDEYMRSAAEKYALANGYTNVTLVQGDAEHIDLADHSFDVVHARLLLTNVSDPHQVVAEMTRLARPGATVALQEVDVVSWDCYPAHPAFGQALELLKQVDGIDFNMGRRLPEILKNAGLADIQISVQAFVTQPGEPSQTVLVHFLQLLRQSILKRDQGSEQLDRIIAQLETHLARPDTIVITPLFIQAWARKPI